ncbi:MAG: trypsin-like peptidase domain-containing protein [Defluviitaleaceae bacterium]|nr:trypsin-like peptidase domain-containing protein [Defluviitaleaceae bacterium]
MKKIVLAFVAVCLGGITLGLGLAAGNMLIQHLTPEAEISPVQTELAQHITTVRVNPMAIPIDPSTPDFVDIIPLVKDSVVSINVTAINTRNFGISEAPGAGSGFIFAEDEDFLFIATNAHVIENTSSITISLDDNEQVPAVAIGSDRASDLAVLAVSRAELEAKGVPFTIATFGDSDIMRMGDPVVAIGNAMGGGQAVTRGIISALDLNINIDDPHTNYRLNLNVLQTDAAVNRGNSGGPLMNQHGEVIGIVTAKLLGADIEGMGYALPSNNVVPVLMELKESGSVRQPFIGISHRAMTEANRAQFNLPATGILVLDVRENTPAEEAGLQVHDLIVYFAGQRITDFDTFVEVLNKHSPGDTVIIGIYRDGQRMDVTLTLGSIIH